MVRSFLIWTLVCTGHGTTKTISCVCILCHSMMHDIFFLCAVSHQILSAWSEPANKGHTEVPCTTTQHRVVHRHHTCLHRLHCSLVCDALLPGSACRSVSCTESLSSYLHLHPTLPQPLPLAPPNAAPCSSTPLLPCASLTAS